MNTKHKLGLILRCSCVFVHIGISLCSVQKNASFHLHPRYKDIYCRDNAWWYSRYPSMLSCLTCCALINDCKGVFYNTDTQYCITLRALSLPGGTCQNRTAVNYYILKLPSVLEEYEFTPADNARLTAETPEDVCLSYSFHSVNAEVDGKNLGCGDAVCCKSKGCYSGHPAYYKGTWSLSESGIPCQRWDTQVPHAHNQETKGFFDGLSLSEAANYCRDPDGEGYMWCYTTDPYTRWESCGIPTCF